jgi:GTP-binding protein
MQKNIRNVAIIAHVDHGKTTLVDQLLRQCGTFQAHEAVRERVMDSNDLEQERGITIFAKNAAINYNGIHINIVDTPGHADFGGEVERVLGMVDGVLLLVDAVEGPMPQTKFVTRKALGLGLKPIVVINKIDRAGARPEWVIDKTFELFDSLGATNEQLDFPVVYASAINGFATKNLSVQKNDMEDLFSTLIEHVPVPNNDVNGGLQLQISALDYSNFLGIIGIGRVTRGVIKTGQTVAVMLDGQSRTGKINQVQIFEGLERKNVDFAEAGDIVLINGIDDLEISTTICDIANPEPLPMLKIDEPTLSMNFLVNNSPLAGQEGKLVTSRQIRDRLQKETLTNVALKITDTDSPDVFIVSGRGELHLSILIENMRREGFELAVSKPHVIMKMIDGQKCEPYEMLTIDIETDYQGAIMEAIGLRKGDLLDMTNDANGTRVRLEYRIPARGLIGFHGDFLTMTKGTGLISHVFDDYGPAKAGEVGERRNGVLISQEDGNAVAYALWNLEDRGRLIVNPGDVLYEGMIIGIHNRDNDLIVNPIRGKKLTNVRASGTDEAVKLTPPIQLTLEKAIEFINQDELVEITPKSIRLRKKFLKENERKKNSKEVL